MTCFGLLTHLVSIWHGSIVMARHALFPETILDGTEAPFSETEDTIGEDGDDDDLDAVLRALSSWNLDNGDSDLTSSSSFDVETSSFGEILTNELQAWRQQHLETPYDDWNDEKKKDFTVSFRKVAQFA